MDNKEQKEMAKGLEPLLRIGKNGLNEGTVKEIKKMLEKRKLVKIKMLKTFAEDRKKAAKDIADKTDSVLVDSVGFVVVLGKKI